MKKSLAFLLLLFGASLLKAQNTTVTGTVIDTDSIAWANGSWKMDFTPNPSQPNEGIYNINGAPLLASVKHQTGPLSGTATFSSIVYQNGVITPAGSTWIVTVCPNASTECGSYKFTAAGTTMDLSTALTPVIPAPRFQPLAGSYGYADVEAAIQLIPGSTYYNVSNPCQRFYDKTSTTWNCASSGGGGGGGTANTSPPAYSVQIANVAATNLASDPSITIDTTHHFFNVGTLPANYVHIGPLSTPSAWFFDTTTPYTALLSLGGVSDTTGTSTPNLLALSTGVPHQLQYSGAIPNGITATTQSAGDNSANVATTQYVDALLTTGIINQIAVYTGTRVLGGTNALPNGTTATTQAPGDNTTAVATDAFVHAAITTGSRSCTGTVGTPPWTCWRTSSDGTLEAWGMINMVFSSATLSTATIGFPVSFFTQVPALVVTVGGSPSGTTDAVTAYYNSETINSATAVVRCATNIGGSGCPNSSATVPLSWNAKQ